MRRTKIVATLGPATKELPKLIQLIAAGADVLRLNFSHGTPEQHTQMVRTARDAADAAGREVALLADLPGPKLRIGELKDGVVELPQGQKLVLTTEPGLGTTERISVSWVGLPAAVEPEDVIYLADGRIRLRVKSVRKNDVTTE